MTSELFLDSKVHFQFSKISKDLDILEQRFINAEGNENIAEIEQLLFAHNGFKNLIHIKLKEALEAKSSYSYDYLIEIFGNIKYAVEEFDRLSNI